VKKAVLRAGGALVLAGSAWLAWSAARAPRAGGGTPADASAGLEPPVAADIALEGDAELVPAAEEPGRSPMAPSSAPVSGKLLDRDSGAVIEGGVVLSLSVIASAAGTHAERVAPGPGGLFHTQRSFPKASLRVQLLEARSGVVLCASREPFDPEHSTWTVRVALGLLVPIDVVGPDGLEPVLQRARVVERGPGGTSEWPWTVVSGDVQPFVRYPKPLVPQGGVAELELEAFSRVGGRCLTGRASLPATRGALAPVRVPLVEDTTVVGRVLDARGRGLEDVTVWLLPLDAPARDLSDDTEGTGAFLFGEPELGAHELILSKGLVHSEPVRVDVRPGRNDLGPLELALPWDDAIRVQLVDPESEHDPAALLVLTELESGRRFYATSEINFFSDDDGQSAFAFEQVPPGRYELRPVSFTGGRFEPASARVVPGAVVTFQAVAAPSGGWGFRVRDAESGDELDEFIAFGLVEGSWLGSTFDSEDVFPIDPSAWLVTAPGYRPLRLPPDQRFDRTTRVEHDETHEVLVADIALERGWSLPVVCRALEPATTLDEMAACLASPLAGARVVADGRAVGTTDAGGLAVVELERAPERIEVELAGWRTVSSYDRGGMHVVLLARR